VAGVGVVVAGVGVFQIPDPTDYKFSDTIYQAIFGSLYSQFGGTKQILNKNGIFVK
jgi:hypothetical protein